MDNNRIRLLVILWIIICLFTSCYTKKSAIEKFGYKLVNDSIRIDTTYRDTGYIYYLPGDTVILRIESPCDSNGRLRDFSQEIKGRNSRLLGVLHSDIVNNKIEVDCYESEYQDSIRWKESIIKIYREKTIHNNYQPKPSLWQKIKNYIESTLPLLVVIALLLIIIKFKK